MKWYQRILKKPTTFIGSISVFCVCLYAYTVVASPPTIEATNLKPTNAPISADFYPLEGTVTAASELYINGKRVEVKNNGRFTHQLPLREGDNTITIEVQKNGKKMSRTYSIFRTASADATATNQDRQQVVSQPEKKPDQAGTNETVSGPSENASFMDGTFTIGRDITPGKYKSSTPGQCRYEGSSATGNSASSILGNAQKEIVVTISPEDISFTSEGCGIWTRVE